MIDRPDYTTARNEAGFMWSVGTAQGALREVTGTPIEEFHLKPEACIDAYRRGRPMIREMFGEDAGAPGLTTPAISYGHASGRGAELLFPEGGEVSLTHPWESLEEGVRELEREVDFATAGMAPFYLDFREKMIEAFPGETVGLSYGGEGPITAAYELRGEGFFTDIYDDLPLAKRFMRALVDRRTSQGSRTAICG